MKTHIYTYGSSSYELLYFFFEVTFKVVPFRIMISDVPANALQGIFSGVLVEKKEKSGPHVVLVAKNLSAMLPFCCVYSSQFFFTHFFFLLVYSSFSFRVKAYRD